MQPIYNMPVIPQNLRREETIIQIAEALDYLKEVSDDILSRVNRRISSNEKYLSSIASRVNVVRLKVDKLSGAKKATQVFSSSKYPATNINKRYTSIFHDGKPLPMQHYNVEIKNGSVKDEPMDTLLFYHVKVKDNTNNINFSGLGDMPANIMSVNDLLLFNTSTNPYNKYVMSDPLQGAKTSKKEQISDTSRIGAAPASITDKTMLLKSSGQSFSYTPDLGEVPAIDVPIHLPDLPGIADDLRYVNELGPGIAPSVTTTPSAPEVPLFEEQTAPIEPESKPIIPKAEVRSVLIPKEEAKVESKPTPPVIEEVKTTVTKELPVPSVDTIPEESVSTDKKGPDLPVQDNAHANLMDAIRKAGGKAKLKAKPVENVPKKSPVVTGDLMSDLHAKLAMRRKGISGSKSEGQSQIESGSAMQKISAMIPPPPTDSDDLTDNANADDQEWDD